ncbi:ABC transporter permease [Achromobacter xylosoxidans]|uniref:ABC transporter permease n=1 Tax=Alcaligenes xylosoxydans xylosoxydans TaxID=85698 RepID=UPI001F13A63F|nr:ABC transporter permease [Achromobacter xylosoxidans]
MSSKLTPPKSSPVEHTTAQTSTNEVRSGLTVSVTKALARNKSGLISAIFLAVVVIAAVFAPWLATYDPIAIDTSRRLSAISAEHWLGTDAFGRDIYSRAIYGAKISLIVGLSVMTLSIFIGMIVGIVAGYFRNVGAVIMRVMDGIMAIPSILLAIALVSLTGGSIVVVLIAITIPEVPRVVRLVRSVVLSVTNEPYVEAAHSLGTRLPRLLFKHMVPNTIAPLIVQGSYIFSSAILIESTLSFLGAGLPPEIASWGNMMAEGRIYFQLLPGLTLYPGILLAMTLLSVNILGDVLRDTLDPKMEKSR